MTQSKFYTLARSLLLPLQTEASQFQKLSVECYEVDVSLDEHFATTEVKIVFRNPNDISVGGTFVFPLPHRADLSNTEIHIDGNLANTGLLKQSMLEAFYKHILQTQDFQALQAIGTSALQTEISPIPAGDTCRVHVRYTESIEKTDDILVYTHHLRSNHPVGSFLMSIEVKGWSAIETLDCPSHNAAIDQPDDEHARLTYQATNVNLDTHFVCHYAFADRKINQIEFTFQEAPISLNVDEPMLLSDVSVPPLSLRSAMTYSPKGAATTLRSPMPPAIELSPPNGAAYHDVFFKGHGTNPFIDTEDRNMSTFGMDADSASYSVTRRYLRDGHLPPSEAVRVEEFVNAFDYDYTLPTDSTFALHLEGAPSIVNPKN